MMWVAGRGLWEQCGTCGKIVKINKLLFGSVHFCLTDIEVAQREAEGQAQRNRALGFDTELK